MGTIIPRKKKDGAIRYTAQIVIKRGGRRVHSEAQTFDREKIAITWMGRRERELNAPGGLDPKPQDTSTLADVIDKFLVDGSVRVSGTKRGILNQTKRYPIAHKECRDIDSADILSFAKDIGSERKPSTVASYLVHLGTVFAVARPAWGYQLDRQAWRDAVDAAKRLGIASEATKRTRRPSLDELDLILTRLQAIWERKQWSVPAHVITVFAIYSARRQAEIVRLRWEDFDEERSRILVRDMKHPTAKIGNHVWVNLVPEAVRILQSLKREGELIFPHSVQSVAHAFWKACRDLGIEDLRFHDLRHEGCTRLFEMGWDIPQVALVSGHRSWVSLKRYTHMRQTGDKYAGWKWLEVVASPD